MSNLDHELEMPKINPDRWSIPPVSFGNIDEALSRVAQQLPIVDRDVVYLWELQMHERAYLLTLIVGMMMFALAVMI